MQKLLSKIGWHSFKTGIQNIIKWLPIIWKDKDYEENYLYRILHKKLDNMEKFFRSKYTYSVNALETADEIKEAKEIVWRLLNDRYFIDLVENINTEEIFNFNGDKLNIDEEHPQYLEWLDSCVLSDRLREEDKKKLFELLRDKIDGWWD